MADKSDKSKFPAYVSFGAFTSFINGLRESGVPSKIDRSLMPSASGSLVSAITSSLKFLGLIDDNGKPTAKMQALVEASDEERKPLYKELLVGAYDFLLSDPEFDLLKATTAQVAEKFRGQEISGSTVTKGIGFLIGLAKAADYKLSPYLKAPPPPRSNGKKASKSLQAAKRDAGPDGDDVDEGDDAVDDPTVERFEIPIPGKSSVKVIVPQDLDADDWEMLQSMITVYIKRWKGFKSKPDSEVK